MKKLVPVFLLLLLSARATYAGVITGGSVGTELWCEQTATDDEWIYWEETVWNVTASSPITVNWTATQNAPNGWATWEVWAQPTEGGGFMGNVLLYPWQSYSSDTWNEVVYPGVLGMWGGAGNATVHISITWGWPE
ncbi:hypothetical protein [Niastella sp. OAS944]|uniref:hypothetical protein n=1 Tax=Niastella sp. OAS944 TaxID=2664089 RepID=UPI00348AE506|nr:hypothetical protein [Chitinophagaceae bacterium OAS944]